MQYFFLTLIREPVLKFEEPDDYTVYCMDTDRKYLIVSGSSHCGMVRLWDRRMTANGALQVGISKRNMVRKVVSIWPTDICLRSFYVPPYIKSTDPCKSLVGRLTSSLLLLLHR